MKIEKNGSKLIIDDHILDLTPYQGQKVTVFLEDDGTITLESKPTHQLAICELQVPDITTTSEDTGETDSECAPVIRDVVQPLDLTGVQIHVFVGGE